MLDTLAIHVSKMALFLNPTASYHHLSIAPQHMVQTVPVQTSVRPSTHAPV